MEFLLLLVLFIRFAQYGDVRHQIGRKDLIADGKTAFIKLQPVVLLHIGNIGRVETFGGIAGHRGAAEGFLQDLLIFPVLSLGDHTYTMSVPPMVTRSTMIDVLAHCAESFFSRAANHISKMYAVEGIRLLLPVFRMMAEKGCEDLDYNTREILYCASIYGGLAINVTGTCFPHTMGYLLTENFGIPHGTACAVFQKAFYEYNKAVVPALAAEYLERIGCSEEEYFSLLEKLTPPCQITMDEALIAEAHSRWINNGSMAKCQGVFSADMADDVLRRQFLNQ